MSEVIDGSQGEGGGQILRTSLALAIVTGTPVRIENIRAGRRRPGLLRQHLTAVHAAQAICGGALEGAALGSREITLRPGQVAAGTYRFAVGTAGSACLVLQTILPPLLRADAPSTVVLEGGTHNPKAPPFDFLEHTFAPLLARMGARVDLSLQRAGFYPAGGGRFTATIHPAAQLRPLELTSAGKVRRRRARALLANLPAHIARRELAAVRDRLGWHERECETVHLDSPGPGNALVLHVERPELTQTVTAFGERGVPAERVARAAAGELRRYLDAGVPVGEHLADQLMIPCALAGAGVYDTLPLTPHATTNLAVIRRFLDVDAVVEERGKGVRLTFS